LSSINTAIQEESRQRKKQLIGRKIIFHVLMILLSFAMFLPFLWMVSSSLKGQYDVLKAPPVWIPEVIHWRNYIDIFTEQPTLLFIFNSFKITLSVVVGQLFFSSLAGYAFARIKFKGRNALFLLYIGTLMIPGQVTMIPLYLIMSQIGWLDTHWPLIIPPFFSAFGVFLMRQFFLTLPKELEEAAELDGCNPFQTYWRIMLPQVKPALAALGVFTFMASWNDLLGPLIYLTSVDKFPLTLGLTFFQGIYTSQWNFIMAGGVISIIPILVLYLAAQKFFERGIVLSGLKG
jgi:multiple sugar transport system permease protein